jgi:hypothetical protein
MAYPERVPGLSSDKAVYIIMATKTYSEFPDEEKKRPRSNEKQMQADSDMAMITSLYSTAALLVIKNWTSTTKIKHQKWKKETF